MIINNNGSYELTVGESSITLYPNEYNGGGVSTPLFIQSILNVPSTNTSYLNVLGDMTYRFVEGFTFTISNSSSGENDGTYSVLSDSVFSSGNNTTAIPVSGFIPNIVPAGYITYQVLGSNQFTSLSLPGNGVLNYGPYIVDDLVQLLINFSSSTPPISPNVGQLWFNSSDNVINVFSNNSWTPLTNTTAPSGYGAIGTMSLPGSGQVYSYTNNTSGTVDMFINGDLDTLQYSRTGTTIDLSTFSTSVTISPGDMVSMTYTLIPSVYIVPR